MTKTGKIIALSFGMVGVWLAKGRWALAQATCTVNGQDVPCDQLVDQAKGALGWGIGIFAVIAVLGIAATIFWLMMIIHAASHPIENRAMWIILMVITGIVGAVIYYFVVKRKSDSQGTPPPVTAGAR